MNTTQLCVSLTVIDAAQVARDSAQARDAGADIVELRIDALTRESQVAPVVAAAALPCIVTCRPTWEGGKSGLCDDARADLLLAAIQARAAYVDIEDKSAAAWRVAKRLHKMGDDRPTKLISSMHRFEPCGDDFFAGDDPRSSVEADVLKVALMVPDIHYVLYLMCLKDLWKCQLVLLSMGEAGRISRILAPKTGAFLTFAALDARSATAPGQIAVAEMIQDYRFKKIGLNTKVFGVVGHPIGHSLSPALHNAAFDATGYDGVYVPMDVQPGDSAFVEFLKAAMGVRMLDITGLSVTIPHKENALRELLAKGGEVDAMARRIGAVNTILIESPLDEDPGSVPDSPEADAPDDVFDDNVGLPLRLREIKVDPTLKLHGYNTDCPAILDAITHALSIPRDQLRGRKVAVLGAGGAARAAVAGLTLHGAVVTVLNRTPERARALATDFTTPELPVRAAALTDLAGASFDIIINTTPLGMHPDIDASPFDIAMPALTPDTVVFDTVYNPLRTKLLAQAQAAGARTIAGIEMFLRQAAAQFELFTKLPAPIDVMRQVIEKKLAVKDGL